MIRIHSLERYFARYPSVAGATYISLVLAFCLVTLFMLTDVVERYLARHNSLEMLSQLNGQNHLSSVEHGAKEGSRPSGSPFLEGQTLTIASAALLQRITSIIVRAGGTVVSSEIDQRGTQPKDGNVTAVANCELEQSALQQVLYDIEAGLPFLYIDQLVVHAPASANGGERLQVRIGVAGLWTGGK